MLNCNGEAAEEAQYLQRYIYGPRPRPNAFDTNSDFVRCDSAAITITNSSLPRELKRARVYDLISKCGLVVLTDAVDIEALAEMEASVDELFGNEATGVLPWVGEQSDESSYRMDVIPAPADIDSDKDIQTDSQRKESMLPFETHSGPVSKLLSTFGPWIKEILGQVAGDKRKHASIDFVKAQHAEAMAMDQMVYRDLEMFDEMNMDVLIPLPAERGAGGYTQFCPTTHLSDDEILQPALELAEEDGQDIGDTWCSSTVVNAGSTKPGSIIIFNPAIWRRGTANNLATRTSELKISFAPEGTFQRSRPVWMLADDSRADVSQWREMDAAKGYSAGDLTPCSAETSCETCTSQKFCAWCSDTEKCMPNLKSVCATHRDHIGSAGKVLGQPKKTCTASEFTPIKEEL